MSQGPLYQRLLGESWSRLPGPLRAMHDIKDFLRAEGIATVERGTGLLSRLIGAVFRFPPTGKDIPVCVSFTASQQRETWERQFAGKSFSSVQAEGRRRFRGLLAERFGPLTVGLALLLDEGRLRLIVRSWSLFGLPLPAALAPDGDSYETTEHGRFHFHVEIRHRLTGLIVRYRGWLVPITGGD